MSSVIYNLNGNDKTLIFDTRSSLLQAFKATNWTDLRLSMMLSITKQNDPNDPTGLTETIGAGEDNNQVYIGFKSSDGLLPPATNFWGLSTQYATPNSEPTFVLGGGIWQVARATHATSGFLSNGISKFNDTAGGHSSTSFAAIVQAQYASLLMLKMTRNDPTLSMVNTLEVALDPGGTYGGNTLYSDTSRDNIRAITAAATFTQVGGPFTFSSLPDSIYCFWPFNLSRLRLHSWVLEKYS